MGLAYLPVDCSWERYLAAAEYTFQDMEGEMKAKLMALADSACKYSHNQRWDLVMAIECISLVSYNNLVKCYG